MSQHIWNIHLKNLTCAVCQVVPQVLQALLVFSLAIVSALASCDQHSQTYGQSLSVCPVASQPGKLQRNQVKLERERMVDGKWFLRIFSKSAKIGFTTNNINRVGKKTPVTKIGFRKSFKDTQSQKKLFYISLMQVRMSSIAFILLLIYDEK